ncbi:DHHC palmitoyltransferase-domain-containing protein [Pyronema domesticum]|uniref:Palmitoyltransferase n=1 Tax=Pyronema omphalodes (strain CBS 100304) TaxID=1076935 RepID=U4L1R9_PYROM|nr:DHHC palmitoyltransferase-domain-containing protein [Pyronema domesticum]CCX10010.1 Similar to Palmitoyltransferase PFA3; acc. no. Q7S7C5 [Pyronema omphalodes CBS 100304]
MDSGRSSPVPRRRRSRTCRRLDKLFCLVAGYFPLFFVYSLTLWATYTQVYSISYYTVGGWQGFLSGSIGFVLFIMTLWCYTYAVFTSPGTPVDNKHAYSHLPTSESGNIPSVTVKSDGQERFCKKCQFRKPDRTHHCSSCNTCVLKMDHHCPWLATCLGLRNYKAFLLFLIYVSLFCIVCFVTSVTLVYNEILNSTHGGGNMDDLTPVNWVLLAVISGIVGLVLSGFTIWHLVLTGSNMTTIESLEKVRYTAPSLRNGGAPPGARLVDENSSSYHREMNRYGNYLLEESSKKLPHAFNLGRARNFAQVFGGREKMLLWFFPMFTGVGDGWNWETSREWQDAAIAVREEREKWLREQGERERAAGWGYDPAEEEEWNRNMRAGNHEGLIKHAGTHQKKPSKADRLLGRSPNAYTDTDAVQMKRLKKPKRLDIDTISDFSESEDDEVIGLIR